MASVLRDEQDSGLGRAEVLSLFDKFESDCKTLLHKLASRSCKYTVFDQCIVTKKLVWCFENMPDSLEHINDVGSNGLTALQNAVSCSNWTLALMLLRAGARTDLICGNTILHVLVCDSISLGIQLPVLKVLVERGENLDHTDPQGHTAIHLAAWRHKWELVKALLEHGASAMPKDPLQLTLFHRLATLSSHSPAFSKKKDTLEDVARILLSRGIDLNQLAEWNGVRVSPLHIAVEKENWLIVEMFLLWGADPSNVCIQGQGILHRIAKSVNFKERGMMSLLMHLILLLQNKGADIDALDCNGDSALCLALAPGSFKPTSWFLLACGAQLQLNKLNDHMIRDFIGNLSLMPKNVLAGDKLKVIIQQLSGAYASWQAMMFLLQAAFRDAIKFENYCIAWVLAECGANLDDIQCSHHVLLTIFRAGRVKRLTRDFEAFLVCMLSVSHNTSLPFQLPCPLHFILKMTQQRLKRYLRDGNPDVTDVAGILEKLIARGANPLELVHSRSALRALLEICCSPNDSHLVFLPVLRVLIEAGVSTHQPALTSLEPDFNQQQISTYSQIIPTVQYRCDAGGPRQNLSCHHFVNPVKVLKILKSPNLLCWTRDPEVVEILIRSGACSNKELFGWREFLRSHEPSTEINSLLKVVDVHANTVPSLMSLARLVVSHSIGCGPQRLGFLEMEGVPEKLKGYIQFQDLFVEHVTHL